MAQTAAPPTLHRAVHSKRHATHRLDHGARFAARARTCGATARIVMDFCTPNKPRVLRRMTGMTKFTDGVVCLTNGVNMRAGSG